MAAADATKICTKCHVEKPLSLFYKHKGKRLGVDPACKACVAEYHRRPEVLARHAETLRNARRAGRYKEWDQAYNKSAKGKLSGIKYRQSEKYKKNIQKRLDDPAYREMTRRNAKKYWTNNRHKRAAHSAVLYAVRKGVIPHISEMSCRSCGKPAKEYHHHMGYEKEHWLDVIPFCVFCHNQQHVKETRRELERKARTQTCE